jgi:mannitol-1-/sugar-/sorbitol-6-/2-deoxyglucose-6-phosphatase
MDRGVVFDMDGLLIDSEPLWKIAEREVFASVGVEVTAEMAEATMALRTDEVTEYWYRHRPWSGPSLKDVENAVIERVAVLIEQRGRPKDGVHYIVDLFERLGYRIGLASNSPDVLIDIVVRKLALGERLHALCSSVHEVSGKPSPFVYLTAAAKLGVAPQRCLAFEDTVTGVTAAKAAAMTAIAVPAAEQLDDPGFAIADLTLDSLTAFTAEHAAALAR